MRVRLLSAFLVFVLVVTVSLELPIGFATAARVNGAAQASIRRADSSFAVLVEDALRHHEPDRVRQAGAEFAANSQFDVLVVDRGRVLLASDGEGAADLASPVVRGIVSAAEPSRKRRAGESAFPGVGNAKWAVTTVPDGEPHDRAVVLVSEPSSLVSGTIDGDWLRLGGIGAIVLLAATLLALLLAESLTRPLRRIEDAVSAIGEGELGARAPTDAGPGELRELAATVNSTAARLDRLLESQRAFAADASHQLRTPLTAIRLRLEHVQRELPLEAALEVEAALAEVRRLSRLANALLELAREEANELPRDRVELDALIEERLEIWRPLAEEQRLALHGTAPPLPRTGVPQAHQHGERLAVLASTGVVEQVLDNLLANAFEATPAGGTVRLYAEPAGALVEVHVLDDGKGLGPGEHERAFDRFWRASNARPGGSGLGLAIVDHLVRRCGGSAELRERAGGGTDAIVRFPTG